MPALRHPAYMVSDLQVSSVMKKGLVVDDEPLILYALARTLQNDGMEVTTVNNGSAALEEIRHCFYHLCFLDLCLPDISGIDVMMKIKELSPESKILIMSASCIDESVKKLIEENACLFIPKPFELTHVRAIVHQLMENRVPLNPTPTRTSLSDT